MIVSPSSSVSLGTDLSETGARIRFFLNARTVSSETWTLAAGESGRVAIDALRRLDLAGRADVEDDAAFIDHAGIAALTPAEAEALHLPAYATAILDLRMSPRVPPDRIEARWTRADGRPLLSARRMGAILYVAGEARRLPEPLFKTAEALERFQQVSPGEADERMRRFVELKDVLPPRSSEIIHATGMMLSMKLAYAEAFSLDADGDAGDLHLLPVLHSGRRETEEDSEDEPSPLLPPAFQDEFARRAFPSRPEARPAYALGSGWYVALSPALQSALQVVREMQREPTGRRQEFLRNPRPWLEARLGAEYEATVLDNLFRETHGYSERVKSLGLWQARVLPWVRRSATDWFGPSEFGLDVGGQRIAIPHTELGTLVARIDAATASGHISIRVPEPDGVALPASAEVRAAIERLQQELRALPPAEDTVEENQPVTPGPRRAAEMPLIATNEEEAEYERVFAQRACQLPDKLPERLITSLKPHQQEGLAWLRAAWNCGRPGVLLADDMGLGKTLQCLAFLAQVRGQMCAGRMPKAPILVVAPVTLLHNWEQEHERHFRDGGLGPLCQAYGQNLSRLRRATAVPGSPRPLDQGAIGEASWVLTTYETLRDNARSFAGIPFSIVVLDEAQRIKNPGTQVTDAAKALNAGFWIAVSGTPVENRLADLWCIIDAIQPGFFPELKKFSVIYEQNQDSGRLGELKQQLETATSTPPIMLRRLKSHHVKGLPEKHEIELKRSMPAIQAEAYRRVLSQARGAQGNGVRLSALHGLRAVSLHPASVSDMSDADFLAASARLAACMEALDQVEAQREKALLFLEDRAMQARLSGLLQRRFRLPSAPAVINGEVSSARRLERVNSFQNGPDGFDVIILSPRAAGVGLTLTAANHVIHLSRWWNPAVEDQCTDRAHRIGQCRDVTVYLPIATYPDDEARSFDINLHRLLARKRAMASDLLAPPIPSAAEQDELFRDTVGD